MKENWLTFKIDSIKIPGKSTHTQHASKVLKDHLISSKEDPYFVAEKGVNYSSFLV